MINVYMRFFIVLLLSTWASASFAQNKILKISEKQKKVAITTKPETPLKVGDVVQANIKNGEPCSITISKIKGNIAIGDAHCAFLSDLIVGQAVTPTETFEDDDFDDDELDIDAETEPPPKANKKKMVPKNKSGLGIGIYYSLADELEYDGQIDGTKTKAKVKGEPSPGFSLFYLDVPTEHLGSFISIDYEMKRKLKSMKGDIGGSPFEFDLENKFQLITLASNLAYAASEHNIFYAGVNLPISFKFSDDANGKFNGALGFQVGAAYRFSPNVFYAFEYRLIKAERTFNDGVTTAKFDIEFNGSLLRLGISF